MRALVQKKLGGSRSIGGKHKERPRGRGPTLHPTLVKVPYTPNKKNSKTYYLLQILCVGIVLMRNPILKKERHHGKAERRV